MLPTRIGLITSPTGAVVHDVLTRLQARCPRPVVVAPALVQGVGAPASLQAALQQLVQLPQAQQPQVIIIARGGGSYEDLMAFNHEDWVRAVAASPIPTISGVGHEPDTTLCDYAADVRAPTPTAAAEIAVPHRAELQRQLAYTQRRLTQRVQELIQDRRLHLQHAAQRLPSLPRLIQAQKQALQQLSQRLSRTRTVWLAPLRARVQAQGRMLATLHPHQPLQRGFVLVHTAQGQQVASAAQGHQLAPAALTLTFADGTLKATLPA